MTNDFLIALEAPHTSHSQSHVVTSVSMHSQHSFKPFHNAYNTVLRIDTYQVDQWYMSTMSG